MLRTDLIASIPELLARHAQCRPERIAFIDDKRSITYGELAQTTERLAGHLQDLGVDVGDRVLLYLDNCVEVAESYLAVPRSGAIAVCVNPQGTSAELEYLLADSGARVVITDRTHLGGVRELMGVQDGALAVIVVDDEGEIDSAAAVSEVAYSTLLQSPASAPRDPDSLDATAWMLYTSGTTGRPKGVYLTQRGCLWVVAACWAPIVGLGPDDVMLSPLPLFHSYALNLCVLAVTAVGASVRILPKFSVTDAVQRLTGGKEGDITVFPGVPTMFHYMLDRRRDEGLRAPSLRLCISAGAVLTASLNEAFEEGFGVPLLDGYGTTETSTMITMNWPTGNRFSGSCGIPLPGLTIRLIDPATGRDVPLDHEGEIWVQGPNVTPGYHNLPDASAAVLVEGWYRTGDLARRNQYGHLTISGRIKELIIRGGENIYPAEVEDALVAVDEIEDAAVVGVPHEYLGEVPVAFVVAAEGRFLEHNDVLKRVGDRIAHFKVPERLIEVEAIPRTGSGKILRFHLQQQLAETRSE